MSAENSTITCLRKIRENGLEGSATQKFEHFSRTISLAVVEILCQEKRIQKLVKMNERLANAVEKLQGN